MNYQKHYDALINRAKNRLLEGYCETHHIIPRCMGGNDDPTNLVDLTAEEHYVAHQLLLKIYPENYSLLYAASMMTIGESRNNKLYGWLRKKMSDAFIGDNNPTKRTEVRSKLSFSQTERLKKDPNCNPMRNPGIANKHKEKMQKLFSGKNNPAKRPEVRNKMSNSMKAYYRNNPEKKQEISAAKKEYYKNNPEKHPSKNNTNRAVKSSIAMKEYYMNNPEMLVKRSYDRKEYIKNHPEAIEKLIEGRKRHAEEQRKRKSQLGEPFNG
jgi:hypothetical protein